MADLLESESIQKVCYVVFAAKRERMETCCVRSHGGDELAKVRKKSMQNL